MPRLSADTFNHAERHTCCFALIPYVGASDAKFAHQIDGVVLDGFEVGDVLDLPLQRLSAPC
jgi:hypothetical protein